MAGDLNAAIEGALAAGAKEIVVSDAHGGMRNLQPEDVNEAAYLIRGSPKPDSMMEGIDDGHYDAALFVGYHSMAGTEKRHTRPHNLGGHRRRRHHQRQGDGGVRDERRPRWLARRPLGLPRR